MNERQREYIERHPHIHVDAVREYPDFDYRRPRGDPSVVLDYRNPLNQVGHQQRAFCCWWALEKGDSMNIGLDLGSHKGLTPYAVHVDLFGTGEVHPQERYRGGGGAYLSDIVYDAARVHEIAPKGSVPFIVSNHSLEHMPPRGNDDAIVEMLCNWMSTLRQGGVLAMVVPDNDEFDVLGCDPDHKNAWGHSDFERRVLNKVLARGGAHLIDFNTLGNHFSFDVVLGRT